MFTKGEINLGFIISTVIGIVIGGALLHVFMAKREEKKAAVLQIVEEKQPVA